MNWLRDNILKILVILGVLVVVTIAIILFVKPKGQQQEVIVSASKYGELENKLQDAAIRYVNSHKKFLPDSVDELNKIELSTLQSNNYIGKLVAVDDSSVKCDGYVEVIKVDEDSNTYRYTPYISCGEYYITKTIGDYIIDKETNNGTFERTSEDGLYKMGNDYVFRGENINNYIKLDDHMYRIIKVDEDKHLQLISINRTDSSYVWDDRYNVERKKSEGINNFTKSRLFDSLQNLYHYAGEDTFFTLKEKKYIIEHDYCIGKRSTQDFNKNSGVECNEKIPLYVGLLSFYEYPRASIDSNCAYAYDKACVNYNYFNTLGQDGSYEFTTLTAVSDDTYQYLSINRTTIYTRAASTHSYLYPVIYINNKTIYSSGTGTYSDPYIVR